MEECSLISIFCKETKLILLLTLFIWVFQERFSSIFTPTNLKDLVGQSFPILSIISPPIDNDKLLRLIFLLFGPNTINLVLETLSISLLQLNQSEACSNS